MAPPTPEHPWESLPPTFETDLGLPGRRRGKVRDVYRLSDALDAPVVMVATDRLSAFDVVLPTPVPGKGVLLTAIAGWWLRWIEARGLSRTHLISTDAEDLPTSAMTPTTAHAAVRGRVTLGRACRVIPVECVVRGYLEGSGWSDYQRSGAVCGIKLPSGLRQCDRLSEPIFTPATKADEGHDENIGFDAACEAAGEQTMHRLRDTSLAIYRAAADYALRRGIVIADTKFEFGLPLGPDGSPAPGVEPILIDEALTPDSSRFWPAEGYEPGRAQASFDKQFVREYLERLVSRGAWDKTEPGPELPTDVVHGTLARYREAAALLGVKPAG